MSRVGVVIPNWNGVAHLPDCMDALAAQTYSDFDIVVVDNGSTDGSVNYLSERWPSVEVLELGGNKGFPAACNAGIRARTSEYIVLLNNDTAPSRDWLSNLVAAMDDAPDYAWASSKLVSFDDPQVIDSAGHTYSIWVGASHNIGQGESAEAYIEKRRLFGATAAASIYRRSLFDDVGLLDEEFFFIHEDTEFDLRANVAGYKCLFVPDALVRHKRGASYEVEAWIHLIGVRNRIWTTRNLPPLMLAWWIVTKLLRALRWVPARLARRRTSARAAPSAWHDVRPSEVVRASVDALRTLPRKRREVAHARRLSSIQFFRVLSETRALPRADARSNQ